MISRNKYKGLIFDFNGVLFWDDALQRESWRVFGTRLRAEPLTDEEIDLHVHGRSGRYTMEYLLGHPISQQEATELTEGKELIYRQMCLSQGDRFALSPGAEDLLETLISSEIPFTIATASAKNNVDFFITNLQLDAWFKLESIVFDDGTIPGKPAPDLFLRAAKNLGLPPESCVVIEDSLSGIQAAVNARIGHIIALSPRSKHGRLIGLDGVDQVLENLAEVQVQHLFSGRN